MHIIPSSAVLMAFNATDAFWIPAVVQRLNRKHATKIAQLANVAHQLTDSPNAYQFLAAMIRNS